MTTKRERRGGYRWGRKLFPKWSELAGWLLIGAVVYAATHGNTP